MKEGDSPEVSVVASATSFVFRAQAHSKQAWLVLTC